MPGKKKRENLNTLMHQLILDDPICGSVKGESSYLIATEYANWRAKLKLDWV